MWKDFPAIFLHQRQKEHFYSRQKIQEFLRHFAVIIRHLSERAEESASETKVHCVHEPDL